MTLKSLTFLRRRRDFGSLWQFDVNEFCAIHILEDEAGPQVGLHGSDLNILNLDSLCVADVEAVGRQRSEAIRVGIDVFEFRRLNGRIFFGAAALVQDKNVVEPDVFDVMAGDSGDERGLARGAVGNDHIADEHAPHFSYRRSFGPPHTPAQAEEEWNIDEVTHSDVGDGDVFQLLLRPLTRWRFPGNSRPRNWTL